MSSYLRPDEEAGEAKVRRAQTAKNVLQSGISTVAGAYGLSKVMPFLNEYIPEDLAFKGINKVFPQMGKFLKHGMEQGLTLKSGLDYIKGEASKEKAKETKNIIEQYSPELHQFIKEKVESGEDPIRAGASALFSQGKKFDKIIKKMEKDHKTDFSSILQTVYGQGQQSQQPKQQQEQPQQGGIDPQLAQILQQGNQLLQKFRGQ